VTLRDIATELTSTLGLDSPPIAVALADSRPPGLPAFEEVVPSACTFWRRAETGAFYATAAQHYRCPIGAMVMGFDLPGEVQTELMSLVGFMGGQGYVGAGEPALIPTLPGKAAGVVYGPLRDFPLEPDFVLIWVTPRQAMIMTEAAGTCHWTLADPPALRGRPACAAIPLAGSRGAATLSLGCVGMRTFTEVADDRMLAVIPAGAVGTLQRALAGTVQANRTMAGFYERRKAS